MARKSKATKRKGQVVGLGPKDYRFPGESTVYMTAVAGMFIVFIWIVAMFVMFKRQASGLPDWRWSYLFIWPIASVLLANYFSSKPRQAQLKKAGPHARVMPANYPEIHAGLSQLCQTVGLQKPPSMYVVDDEMAFIFSMPGKSGMIMASKPLVSALTHQEFMALVAREVGLIAARDVRVGLAITWIQTANPLIKVAFLPLVMMATFMRGWVDLTELTADRAAILLTNSEATVNLALVKLVIAQDPNADVNQEDLEAYMRGSADISADSAQLERHFRIGRFIEAQSNLRERIEQIKEYRGSLQGQAAFAKLG